MDKYGIDFTLNAKKRDKERLINQLWKLIPMRENGEDWASHLFALVEEIGGLADLYRDNPNGLILLSKLEGLNHDVCGDFMLYRKTVFRCIELLGEILDE